jgi:hypothetical protein
MILFNYLNELISKLYDENIPEIGRLALAVFIFSLILLISYLNTMAYFIILLALENKTIQNWVNQQRFIKKIIYVYKKTRIGFVVFWNISVFIYYFIFALLWL